MSPASGGADAPLSIGVDYGTESGRVLILDLASGNELGVATVPYRHGVIDHELPSNGAALPPDWALQHPSDYLEVLTEGIPAALSASGVNPSRVIGIGLDFTSCTVLPARSDGTPLCLDERFSFRPHAWTKLWKHHAAQHVADRLNEVAIERNEAFLARYGGRISSEWYFPKLIQVFLEDREVYDATDAFVEATDWVVWQLTGSLSRSACAAGYKALWSATDGLPSAQYFAQAVPGFDDPAAKLGRSFMQLGERAGSLQPALAERLGLPAGIAVAVGNVDSFVSVPGCGVGEPGVFVTVVGTSICDMVVHADEVLLEGITGVVRDGIVPGLYGYEAGQPAVGDMFAWYVDRLLGGTGARYGELEAAAASLSPGESGLVALDWWNGNRSVLGDADLAGAVVGFSLQTTPGELYRALLESVAYGARTIIENFESGGMALERVVACGGIAEKSELMMQLFADVSGLEVEVAGSTQVPARGSALFGAVAAGRDAGGFADIATAAAALALPAARTYKPNAEAKAVYDRVFALYRSLHDTLGRRDVQVMHELKALRRSQRAAGA
ncbi:MAG: ribulokinase [Actinomycetota bacterium]|nr:ribulokinase [Actinomycetota bacterium]